MYRNQSSIRILNVQLQHCLTTTSKRSLPLVTMTLADFMKRSHTVVYPGYNHQSNIGLFSALVLGNAKVLNKHKLLENLKGRPNQLINATFNLIDSLNGECDRRNDHNSYELLDVWTKIYDRQVFVLESSVNNETCVPEKFEDVRFQVRYNTSPCGFKRPIILWETCVLDGDDHECVHFHTVLTITNNVIDAIDPSDNSADLDYKRLMKRILYQYDTEGFSFRCLDSESEFLKWVQRLDNIRGGYKWVDGRPLQQDPLTELDIINALDKVKDDHRRVKECHERFKEGCAKRKLADSFLHVSKALIPSQYNDRSKRHLQWCSECNQKNGFV